MNNLDQYVPGYGPQGGQNPMQISPIGGYNPLDGLDDIMSRGMSGSGLGMNNFVNNDMMYNGLGTDLGQGMSSMGALSNMFRGNIGMRDAGSVLGGNIQNSNMYKSGQEFYKENHGDLSAKNQFGNIWGGLKTLNGLYGSIKQSHMANKQYGLQKDMWQKSWDANRKSVNESVDLRAANRFNERPEERAAHVKKYSI